MSKPLPENFKSLPLEQRQAIMRERNSVEMPEWTKKEPAWIRGAGSWVLRHPFLSLVAIALIAGVFVEIQREQMRAEYEREFQEFLQSDETKN